MDLVFRVDVEWSGVGRTGEGTMHLGGRTMTFSAPESMGGKGVGASPEDLLLAAVTACYSGTLMRVLTELQLPAATLAVHTEGIVEDYPAHARYARIVVNPTIRAGDTGRQAEYEAAAKTARDRCFIGKTVRDTLEYTVGRVSVEA